MTMTIARTRAEFDDWRDSVDECSVVLTMGALHQGHASLVRLAQESGLPVVLTVFVNPTQFAAGEDLDRYPRTEAADLALAESLGVDCVWLPQIAEIYPESQPVEVIEPGPSGEVLEGAARPGHFTGVLTVVNRFFELITPSMAVFGKKDRQQLILIERMVRARKLAITILSGETMRESDGLAMSSRNRYLNDRDRLRATALSRALSAAVEAGAGVREARAAAEAELADLDVDYLAITDEDLVPVPEEYAGAAIILAAIRLGETRLIDNMDLVVQP